MDIYHTNTKPSGVFKTNPLKSIEFKTSGHSTLTNMTLSTTNLTTGTWHRVLLTFTGTSEDTSTGDVTGTATLYLNGSKLNSSTSAIVKNKTIRFTVTANKTSSISSSAGYSSPTVYVDNVAMVTGDIDTPPAPIKSGYSVSGPYLTVSGSPAVSTFVNNLTLTRKSYKVKVFNANGVQVGNDTIVTSGMTARIYNGSDFVTQYYIK